MIEKRKRGRPVGTGKDDGVYLRQVASLILDDAKLKPTTAMHRAIRKSKHPESDETLVRRLQVKWKAQGTTYLDEARQQRDRIEKARTIGMPRSYITDGVPASYFLDCIPEIGAAMRNLAATQGIGDAMRAMRAFSDPMSPVSGLASVRAATEVGKILKDHQSVLQMVRENRFLAKALEDHRNVSRMQSQIREATAILKAHRGF